jgi:hypothetical protein
MAQSARSDPGAVDQRVARDDHRIAEGDGDAAVICSTPSEGEAQDANGDQRMASQPNAVGCFLPSRGGRPDCEAVDNSHSESANVRAGVVLARLTRKVAVVQSSRD